MSELLNHLDAVVTFVVGSFAIFLYLKQKSDNKRMAARLILQEIRYAEQQIRNARSNPNGYSLAVKLLPTNNWSKSIHLFVKTLEIPEIDNISQFYAQASFVDMMIEKITNKKSDVVLDKPKTEVGELSELPKIDPSKKTQELLALTAAVPLKFLNDVSAKIEFLYDTSAVEKLRIIARTGMFRSMLRKIVLGDI